MKTIRRTLPLLVLPFALLIAGCSLLPPSLGGPATVTTGGSHPAQTPSPSGAATAAGIEAQRAAWTAAGIRSYTWTVSYGCECSLNGPVTVTVVDGKVAAAKDAQGVAIDLQTFRAFPMTLDALWDQATKAIDGGGTASITEGSGGVPKAVTLDPIPNAIDDELYVTVFSFTPAG